jgi:hypothetical protein
VNPDTVLVRVSWTASSSETFAFDGGASIDKDVLMKCVIEHAIEKIRNGGDLVFDKVVIDEITDGNDVGIIELNIPVEIKR